METFFMDLKNILLTIPDNENEHQRGVLRVVIAFHNSAFYWYRSRYFLEGKILDVEIEDEIFLSDDDVEKSDRIVLGYLMKIMLGETKPGEQEVNIIDKNITYDEIRESLKVKKSETFKKYFPELGIKIYGSKNAPLISESDFIKLKQFWQTRR